MFDQITSFLHLPSGSGVWVVPLLGLAMAFGVFVLGRLLVGANQEPKPPGVNDVGSLKSFLKGSTMEKRGSPRRAGNHVEVLITDAEGKKSPYAGWVLDRSIGGLSLHVRDEVSVGTVLQVLPKNAPKSANWIHVEVKSCQPDGGHWQLGCAFMATPPYGTLLLFG